LSRFEELLGGRLEQSVSHLILAVLLIAASASVAEATNYFLWDAETMTATVNGAPATFSTIRGNSSLSTDTAHGGARSLKMLVPGPGGDNPTGIDQVNGTNPCATTIMGGTLIGGPAIYHRWWMNIKAGFSWGSGTQKTKAYRTMGTGDGAGATFAGYTGYLHRDGFGIHECATGINGSNGTCRDARGIPDDSDSRIVAPFDMRRMADSKWHEYIVMVKPNTTARSSDAQLKVWIDGVQRTQYLDWHLNDNGAINFNSWCGWMVMPYWQLNGSSSDGGTIYVDDFSTDDVYNSTFSGGPPRPESPSPPRPSR
jgi:hypothetical protein